VHVALAEEMDDSTGVELLDVAVVRPAKEGHGVEVGRAAGLGGEVGAVGWRVIAAVSL
jgi:hypothetical protein